MLVSKTENFQQLIDILNKGEMKAGVTGRKIIMRDANGKVIERVSLNQVVSQMKKICSKYQTKQPFDNEKFNTLIDKIKDFHDIGNQQLKKSLVKRITTSFARIKNIFGDSKKGIVTKDSNVGIEKLKNELMKLVDVLKNDEMINSSTPVVNDEIDENSRFVESLPEIHLTTELSGKPRKISPGRLLSYNEVIQKANNQFSDHENKEEIIKEIKKQLTQFKYEEKLKLKEIPSFNLQERSLRDGLGKTKWYHEARHFVQQLPGCDITSYKGLYLK